MSSRDLVTNWFGREAARFDAIYEGDKNLRQRVGDAIFRRVVLERYSLVVNAIGAPGQTVLDVGCGPGRYGIELAKRGARNCLGLDMAAPMIDIARRQAERAGVAARCDWIVSDFLAYESREQFDAVIAMGYFDYLEDPAAHLAKMVRSARGRVFASFPMRWEIRVPLRKARFLARGGFVRFYSRRDVAALFVEAGDLRFLSLVNLGRDLIAIYDAGGARVVTRRSAPRDQK